MLRDWRTGLTKLAAAAGIILAGAGFGRADDAADLRKLIEEQSKQIQELKQRLDTAEQHPVAAEAAEADAAKGDPAALSEASVRKIVADYLQENPGAGMPPSVQTGFWNGQGFVIRSAQNPKYIPWEDESKIPFELRIRGRIQADYYMYNPTDHRNHQTGQPTDAFGGFNNAANTALNDARPPGMESDLLIKRARFTMLGTLFDPNLRYYLEMDGNTRGIANTNNTTAFAGTNGQANYAVAGNPAGNGVGTVDHAVRLFSAYVAYDWHPCCGSKGCGGDCCDGATKYSPTVTFIIGKYKPYFSFEEYMGSGNEQFVEYAMSEWFFDADDDNLAMQAGIQIKAMQDRLFACFNISNGNETQTPYQTLDDYPGVNFGFWYDFGGNWNEQRKAYDLYGDCVSDIDYSCKPVVRVGAMANIVPNDRRSIYGNTEYNRIRASTAAPGGTTFINQFNPLTVAAQTALFGTNGASVTPYFAMDEFDEYTYEAFIAGKWRGFSFLADAWYRVLNGFHAPNTRFNPDGAIVYAVPAQAGGLTARAALFPNSAIHDYGLNFQSGYFIVPKKLEIAARWSSIYGQSGDIYGNGTVSRTVTLANPNAGAGARTGAISVINGAFTNYHNSNEYAIGINYFFRRQLVKWQTDFSVYDGGNPAAGGSSAAGFLAGVDGWMVRSQIQLGW